jgi:hypothetical protein
MHLLDRAARAREMLRRAERRGDWTCAAAWRNELDKIKEAGK